MHSLHNNAEPAGSRSKKKSTENWSRSQLFSRPTLLCATQCWGNTCSEARLIAYRLITRVCKKISRCINSSAMLCIFQCRLPSLSCWQAVDFFIFNYELKSLFLSVINITNSLLFNFRFHITHASCKFSQLSTSEIKYLPAGKWKVILY